MLHRGMNFVPVYFTLSAALTVLSPDLWLEGKTVQPGLTVLGGPFNCQKQMQQPSTSSQTTCYASMTDIEMTNPVPIDDITAYINSGTKELDPIPQTGYSTMLAIDCRHKRMIINDNVILAQLRPSTAADKASFTDAASTTACQLSDAWLTWAQMNSDQPQPSHSLIQQGSYPRQTWKLSEQAKQAKHYILIVIMMNMSLRNKMVNQVAFPKTIFYNHDRCISILTSLKSHMLLPII